MTFSPSELEAIRDQLFLVQGHTALTLPTNSVDADGNDDPMVTNLESMINADLGLIDLGIGVANFTKDPGKPQTFLHNGPDPWRIASTGKLAVLLAAVQLRDDVRLVKESTGSTDPKAYDALFAMPELWRPLHPFDLGVLFRNSQIAQRMNAADRPTNHCPRVSTMFDLTKDPIDFRGPTMTDDANKRTLVNKLGWHPPHAPVHLTWARVPKFEFSELIWLMGDLSDNVAATACISEIGIAYLKAVQRAYGLFDASRGAHLLLAQGYDRVPSGVRVPGAAAGVTLRPLRDTEKNDVTDALWTGRKTGYSDHSSGEPGSATALLAYMIALVQNRLVSSRNDLARGRDNGSEACATIRGNLSTGAGYAGPAVPATTSYIANGLDGVTTVSVQLSKIGILYESDGEPPPGLDCEFVYLETAQGVSGKKMKYGVVVTGIRHSIETKLAQNIHQILLKS